MSQHKPSQKTLVVRYFRKMEKQKAKAEAKKEARTQLMQDRADARALQRLDTTQNAAFKNIKLIAQKPSQSAIKKLRTYLKHPSPVVRAFAAKILLEIADPIKPPKFKKRNRVTQDINE